MPYRGCSKSVDFVTGGGFHSARIDRRVGGAARQGAPGDNRSRLSISGQMDVRAEAQKRREGRTNALPENRPVGERERSRGHFAHSGAAAKSVETRSCLPGI